jgi:glyoxylase-like metal-dependent hydrolase (beta-lactamase superfamily II)
MGASESYTVTVLLDVNNAQDVDDRAEARTYLVADRGSGKAVIIDAVIENVERDCKIIRELGMTLLYALETHVHADHITGASLIKARTDARIVYGGSAKGAVIGADIFLYMEKRCRSATHLFKGSPRQGIRTAVPVMSSLAQCSLAIPSL